MDGFAVLMSVYKNDTVQNFSSALDSIIKNQSKHPSQIIIVKDGPVSNGIDDEISAHIKKYKDTEFTIISKKVNEGLAAALNDGMLKSNYEWIARMDADDVADPRRFEKQINYIENHPDVDVLGGNVAEFIQKPGDTGSSRIVPQLHDEIVRMAKVRNPMNHQTVMYKKSAVTSVGAYSVDFGKLEDYKLWVDLISAGYKFANINEVLVNFRIGNAFLERRSNRREIYDWDMLQRYMLSKKMISRFSALKNRIYIRGFIYLPVGLKKLIYKYILRSNLKNRLLILK